MRTMSCTLLMIALAAIMLMLAAVSPPAMAQFGRPVWLTTTVNNRPTGAAWPGNPAPAPVALFEWLDFEHAWAPPASQVNPAVQPPTFDPFGIESNQFSFVVLGARGWPIDVTNIPRVGPMALVNQNQTVLNPPPPLPYQNSQTVSATSGTPPAQATAQATATVQISTTTFPPGGIIGAASISGSAVSSSLNPNPGLGAYKYASSTLLLYVGRPNAGWWQGQWGAQWTWFITGISNAAGAVSATGQALEAEAAGDILEDAAGVPPPGVRDCTVARFVDGSRKLVSQQTLCDSSASIDWATQGNVEASIQWEPDPAGGEEKLTMTNVLDGQFRVNLTGDFLDLADRGTIDVRVHHGVVTTSRATGVFNAVMLPPKGTAGDFTIVLPTTRQAGYAILDNGLDLEFGVCAAEADPTAIWYGAGTGGNWSEQGNWLYGKAPGSAVPLYFSSLAPGGLPISHNDLPGSPLLDAIIFRQEAASYTVEGKAITLDGLVQNRAPGPQVLTLDINLASEGVTFDTLAGDLVVEGKLFGPGALTKSGPGTLRLTRPLGASANDFRGGTEVTGGTLEIGSASALPAGTALTIGAGGTVVLSSGLSTTGAAGGASGASTAVPEPGTLVLLAVLVLTLALGRRRPQSVASECRVRIR